jgi:hypothetical protein
MVRTVFLGRTPEANVFMVELVGIHMALEIAQQQTTNGI